MAALSKYYGLIEGENFYVMNLISFSKNMALEDNKY